MRNETYFQYFDPATPGVYPAVYDGAIALNVEFDPEYLGDFDEQEGYLPRITCIEDEVSGIARGKVFVIEGNSYVVREIQGLKTGILSLKCQKQ